MKGVVAGAAGLAVAAILVCSPLARAQSTNDPGIEKRMENQQGRIQQGVDSGQLTPKEAGRLQAQQARIKQHELRAKADGNLTPGKRAKLARQQNRASRNIYRLKHNDKTVPVS